MSSVNQEISRIFRETAEILEIKGENIFRIRAYERAAQNIAGLTEELAELAEQNRLSEIPGIGKDLSAKIQEFLDTGKIKAYEELKKNLPEGLLELLNIPSVGPKTVQLLYEKLKIKDIDSLRQAISQGRLLGLAGIKEKTITNMLKGLALLKKSKGRIILSQARQVADEFIAGLKKSPALKRVSIAGSLRRQKETVRDIDILVSSDNPPQVMREFSRLPQVKEILAQGPSKSSVRTQQGLQVDCRVVEERSYAAALVYFTGSKDFNIKLRQLAMKKGLKVNEYGVFRKERFIAGRSEEEVFKSLGLAYIEPELREDKGEIELAKLNKLPRLIELKDIRGDLHVHSLWSDGKNSLEELREACISKGYVYAAISDHSQGLKVAGGLTPLQLKKKRLEIERLNRGFRNFRLLFGTEVEIHSDARLDYSDEVLREFDLVIAAIHSSFRQSRLQLTRRIIKACQNKYVHIIAHPTGRLFGVRDSYEIDFAEVLKACADTNTALEVNGFPQRLDLNDLYCRLAKERKVKLAINSDAHGLGQLAAMDLGLAVARRGWLEAEDAINTLPLEKLLAAIKK